MEYFIYLNLVAICYPLAAFMGLALIYHQFDHDEPLWRWVVGPLWYLAAAAFYLVDVALNYTLLVLYTGEPPGCWGETVTARFKRYLKRYRNADRLLDRWRYGLALFFCRFLNRADPGHCGRLPS